MYSFSDVFFMVGFDSGDDPANSDNARMIISGNYTPLFSVYAFFVRLSALLSIVL